MRFERPSRRRRGPGLTPLIDVVFLLLVFFMLASRFDREALLPLTLVLAWLWPWLAARRWVRAGFGIAVAASFGIQIVGAFFAPCAWYATPVVVDRQLERLWDWSDTQIERCLAEGLRDGPRPFVFLD